MVAVFAKRILRKKVCGKSLGPPLQQEGVPGLLRHSCQAHAHQQPSPEKNTVLCSFDGQLPTIQGSPLPPRTEILGEALIYHDTYSQSFGRSLKALLTSEHLDQEGAL